MLTEGSYERTVLGQHSDATWAVCAEHINDGAVGLIHGVDMKDKVLIMRREE